jgi:hypothetical protein
MRPFDPISDDFQTPGDKPIIVLDFDGVIHSYTSGWQGMNIISDPPTDGAVDAVNAYLDAGYQVAVLSSRSHHPGGMVAMKEWIRRYGFPVERIAFPDHKPPAIISIDDRGCRFEGEWPSVDDIERFKPWNR